MRFIKYSIAALMLLSFSSCLKSKNDLAGLKDDKGGIVTSIAERQYLNVDAQNVQLGFINSYANFSFTTPATEDVKFLTLHISQPRETKLSGPLKVKISMTALAGYTLPPAGVVSIPTDVSVPASSAAAFDYSVKFTVNKALLNAATAYGATFTLTGTDQGVYSELDKSIDVAFNLGPAYNTSRYTARYQWSSTLVDAAKQFGITANTKPIILEENVAGRLDLYDYFNGSGSLYANNLATGANQAIFTPRYVLDATGKVTSILVQANGAGVTSTNVVLDAGGSNQFVYTDNNTRTMTVKYSFTLTSVINGVSTPRTVNVTDVFTYDLIQVF